MQQNARNETDGEGVMVSTRERRATEPLIRGSVHPRTDDPFEYDAHNNRTNAETD